MKRTQYQPSNRRGFTIIEVVLVLAIAGLIFLMVFIALPNMQMAQRNTQRRNDYNSLSTSITNYATNHNANFPTSTNFQATWLNSTGTDPDGNAYEMNNDENVTSAKQVWFESGKTCSGDGNPRDFKVVGYIEDGSADGDTYCLESKY